MNDMDGLIDPIARLIGVEGASVLATLTLISLVARLIGKAIPDDMQGWLGTVRKIAKIIGLYTSNRVTSNVSVTDVAKVLLDSKVSGGRDAESGQFTAQQTVEEAARAVK